MASFLRPLVEGDASRFALRNERTGLAVADHLLPAFDSPTRRKGLLKQDFLPDGTAMILAPAGAIHTFFMRFAIDVVFMAKDGRVLKVCRTLRPWRIAAAFGSYAAIELPAGWLVRSDTQRGDRLIIAPR